TPEEKHALLWISEHTYGKDLPENMTKNMDTLLERIITTRDASVLATFTPQQRDDYTQEVFRAVTSCRANRNPVIMLARFPTQYSVNKLVELATQSLAQLQKEFAGASQDLLLNSPRAQLLYNQVAVALAMLATGRDSLSYSAEEASSITTLLGSVKTASSKNLLIMKDPMGTISNVDHFIKAVEEKI
ncbi:MAG TPA: hypothetical protein PLV25_06470, partial [Opitutales bacterium]|nr:hypothetical protein [Opitutales bacterium]